MRRARSTKLYWNLVEYAVNAMRSLVMPTLTHLPTCWQMRLSSPRVIVVGYRFNLNLPGQVAHQYTEDTDCNPTLPLG